MAIQARLNLKVEVKDETDSLRNGEQSRASWLPATALNNGKRETVTLTLSAFTALSPPTGAKVLIIPFDKDPNTAIINCTLKGVTGDTGVKILPASAPPNIPLVLPLGASPSIGITNGEASNQTIEILWL